MSIPLDEVQYEWQSHRGLHQLQTAGIHFNIFQDLYNGRVFRPLGFMEVTYGDKTVHRGTILTPSEVYIWGHRGGGGGGGGGWSEQYREFIQCWNC